MDLQPQRSGNAPSLANFSSLPYELRARIIEMACPWFHHWILPQTRPMALSLMLVSRDVYSLIAPRWFRTVVLSRPSTLSSFLQAVIAKPALGQLVTSLWLGPKDLLPEHWWPLGQLRGPKRAFEARSISTSLSDERQLPRGCSPRQRWPLTPANDDKMTVRDKAILEALDVAQEFIGVDLKRPRNAPDGSKIGSMLWLIGVMEVQAALDLYLMELRRLEDERAQAELRQDSSSSVDEQNDEDFDYPALELTTATSAGANVGEGKLGIFKLHRTRLLQYMTQRGGPADHFDHPLLFARSGIKTISFTKEGRGSLNGDLAQEAEALYLDEDGGYGGDAFANLALPSSCAAVPLSHDLVNPLDQASYPPATVGGNVHMARLLLSLTSSVKTLILTGVPQRAICGQQASLPPPSLRYLSLGPLSPLADESLSPRHDGGRLAKLERLCIRGCSLGDQKRACITALSQLKRIDWDLQNSNKDLLSVIGAFRPLVDEARSKTDVERRAQRKRSRATFESSESSASSAPDKDSSSSRASPSEGSGADSSLPELYIGVNDECESALGSHFASDAAEAWDYDDFFYERPWRVRVWMSDRYSEYEASEERQRSDLVSKEVSRAYADVRGWWSP